MDTDRNLLFGVLALQGDLIRPDQFVEACSAWASSKAKPLSDLLAERGWITPDDRAHLDYFLERRLQQHGGDAHQSLMAAAKETAQRVLADIPDPDIQHSLGDLPRHEGHVLISTIAYQPETRERYTLTRLHAKGGIGQVWLARDADLGREVALKELRPERAANPGIWARFLEEARITGQLEHPGIVPVYELARRSDDQKPFYTMRFVRGRTLSEATRAYHVTRAEGRAGPLELQGLLYAFIGVCNAVAYAHSRGVIHRDLKGQNVVLGEFGEVMVLDWGLAKVVGHPEDGGGERGLVLNQPDAGHDASIQGQALGTPAYMAPEQASGEHERIDRRTDVYGLGAILYEILAGGPPFQGDDTAEVLRRVIHDEPARPRQINPDAPAALEAICRKALAKRPEDRYARAEDVARDVQRFLADEPVSVHRDPMSTRLTRWGRRHRTAAVGLAALLSTAVVMLSIGAVLINRERGRAEESFRQARQAVDDYFTTVSESRLLNVPGLQPLRKELLEQARKYYQSFLQQRGDDPSVRAEAAASLYRVADITDEIGTKEDAVAPYTRALVAYEGLVHDRPDVIPYQVDLAMVCNNLGGLLHQLGRTGEAMRLQEKGLATRERLAREHPDGARFQNELAKSYSNLGALYFASGQQAQALDSFQAARRISEDLLRHPNRSTALPTALGQRYNSPRTFKLDLAHDLYWISLLRFRLGQTDEAIRTLDETRTVYESVLQDDPADSDVISALAVATEDSGFYRLLAGRVDEAGPYLERAYTMADDLSRANPAVDEFRRQLAAIANDLGWWMRQKNRLDEATALQQRALTIQEAIVRGNPGVSGYRWTLANVHRELGWLHRLRGQPEAALRSFTRARDIDAKLPESYADRYCELAKDWALLVPLTGWGKADESLAPSELAERQRQTDEAMAALRRAVAGGFRNGDYLARCPDLEPLRSRADFRSLIESVEAKAP